MKKTITILLLLIAALTITACNSATTTPEVVNEAAIEAAVEAVAETVTETEPTPQAATEPVAEPETVTETTREIIDREGYTIPLPPSIDTIVTIGPSITEIIVDLGFASHIIATDSFSGDVAGLSDGAARDFGIMDFDAEYIVNLMPDMVFMAGVSRAAGGSELAAPIAAAGITVVYVPTSESIAAIMEDIRFIAQVMDAEEAGNQLVSTMQAEIDAIANIAANITTPRTVYFEISPAPWMFSFGQGTFLHEMIALVGATNIFAAEEGWLPVSEEILLAINPDIILTSTDFLPDPIAEIMERPGFDALSAVQNGNIHTIDTNASNRPSHNITQALQEIAAAVFPEYFS